MKQISPSYQLVQFPSVFFYKSIALREYYNQQLVTNKYLLESNLIRKQHIHMLLHKYLLQFHTCICHRTFNQFSQRGNSLAACRFYPKFFYRTRLFPTSLEISPPFLLGELEAGSTQIIPCRRNLPLLFQFRSYSTTLYLP